MLSNWIYPLTTFKLFFILSFACLLCSSRFNTDVEHTLENDAAKIHYASWNAIKNENWIKNERLNKKMYKKCQKTSNNIRKYIK